MADQKASGSVPADVQAVERGTQYPADSIAVAISNLDKVRTAVGYGPAAREVIAQALGFKAISGHAARRLGALSHFGLMDRAGKGSARISALGQAILMPTSPDERMASVAEAVKRPNLYATLITRLAGQALPSMLANLLVRDHGIHPKVSEHAVVVFRESLDYAGMLRNGIVLGAPDAATPSGGIDDAVGSQQRPGGSKETVHREPPRVQSVENSGAGESDLSATSANTTSSTILLDSTGRSAVVQLPLPITLRDLRKISAWLKYMSSVLEDDETPDLSAN